MADYQVTIYSSQTPAAGLLQPLKPTHSNIVSTSSDWFPLGGAKTSEEKLKIDEKREESGLE